MNASRKVVRLWDDWRLLHLGNHKYELLHLYEDTWLLYRLFSALDDIDAIKRTNALIAEFDREKPV